jgi:hypothetical protein
MEPGDRIEYRACRYGRCFKGRILEIDDGWLKVQPDHKETLHHVSTEHAIIRSLREGVDE